MADVFNNKIMTSIYGVVINKYNLSVKLKNKESRGIL
nr:MAG TPA: hypothetical protein [Caudoviricetes sp.]